MKGKVAALLFLSWLLTDDGVEHRNVFKSSYYLYHRICLTIDKIVYYQHLLVSFEKMLSLRLSDHFALVVGCINNNFKLRLLTCQPVVSEENPTPAEFSQTISLVFTSTTEFVLQ